MENENQVEYASYQQVSLPRNENTVDELISKLNGRIVLLKSEPFGYFIRGRISYDEKEPRVFYLEYKKGGESVRKKIHLNDLDGLLLENNSS